MADFPTSLTEAVDNETDVLAKHLNNLEFKVGIDSSAVTTSHDYKLNNPNISLFDKLNAPEGFLINGKIVPSVASNNLTVAIKGMDGNDPSATNPVYVRIDGVIRSITAALSVTKNAATGWCNAGSAELATKEIDFFAYLGYNATDGVVIGFSRIPYATLYSDFSTTTTNEKYCGISTITNAAAGDTYTNIGRFAATLSAGAGYTWSVPTFTSANLIQRPIYETRWLTWVPTISWTNMPTSLTTHYTYKFQGDMCYVIGSAKGTTNANNCGVTAYFTTPMDPAALTTNSTSGTVPIIGGLFHVTDNASYDAVVTNSYYNGADNYLFNSITASKPNQFYFSLAHQI